MIRVFFSKRFIRAYADLDQKFKTKVKERIKLFKDKKNHPSLKVHKLHGELGETLAFSVDYRHRIIFIYLSETKAVLLAIGDHGIYKK